MELPPVLSNVVTWLRAGYPSGVPDVDYVPLFAILGYHLSTDEVNEVAAALEAEEGPTSADSIKKAIESLSNNKPLESDIDRVRARLAAGGWPLADLPRE